MDAYGHVNNARFLTLFEEARVALMFRGAREAGITSLEEGVIIARHEIDYLRPVDFRAAPHGAAESPVVRIESWIEEIKAARFTVAYELFDGEALASRARTVCAPYDLSKQRPRRLTEAERAFLSGYQ